MKSAAPVQEFRAFLHLTIHGSKEEIAKREKLIFCNE